VAANAKTNIAVLFCAGPSAVPGPAVPRHHGRPGHRLVLINPLFGKEENERPGSWNFSAHHAFVLVDQRIAEQRMASTKDAASTIEDIQRDLQALRNDVAQLGQQVGSLMASSGDEAIEGAKERIRRMRANIDETVTKASERSREALTSVSENVSTMLEESLREHPLTTVALALGLGFLVGTTWRR
jgi:ElaB/YqjD/DUF883 family membrane-anchored ribosome-binding protein